MFGVCHNVFIAKCQIADRDMLISNFDEIASLSLSRSKMMPRQDCELLPEDLEKLVKSYKAVVQLELGEEFPEDPKAQLWGAVGAVFNSWMNQRAKTYRPLVIVRICQSQSKENSRDHTRSYLDALSHQSEYVNMT